MQPETQLAGGIANAGSVTRSGDHVLRPSNPHTPGIHRFLRSLRDAGFDGASMPVGVDADGRERLEYVEGDVPVPPYPDWAQRDDVLVSTARLLARFHAAAAGFRPSAGDTWSDEMRDPRGGPIVCHNDVCLENVVFRDGVAVGLLDFDFAAPGRPIYDVASFARMCVPVDDETRARFGWKVDDLPRRLRLVADACDLSGDRRGELLTELDDQMARGGQFMLRRVEAGDANFIDVWNAMGGMARFDRRREWWAQHRPEFAAAMS